MKNVYWEYYHPNKEELKQMKRDASFVFDACSLLNLYSFNKSKTEKIFSILDSLQKNNRIWIPHQFGEEYHKNRQQKIAEQRKHYSSSKEQLDKILNTRIFPDFSEHYGIDEENIKGEIKKTIEKIKAGIDEIEKEHPKWEEDDLICKKIEGFFDGKTGCCYTDSEIGEKMVEIETRMKIKKQPGLSDNKSLNTEKINGDAIGWLQIIDYANLIKKSIILVTEEKKSDYWDEKKKSDKVFPRRSLVREIFDKTGQLFFILNVEEFCKFIEDNDYIPVHPQIGKDDSVLEESVTGSEVVGSESNLPLTNQ